MEQEQREQEQRLHERVRRGAELLDLKVPGWETKINQAVFDGTFVMTSWTKCVAGTLELVKFGARGTVNICLNGSSLVGYRQAEDFGFYTKEMENGRLLYTELEKLWLAEVKRRIDREGT